RLELNVFLPARGTVYVGPIELKGLGSQGFAGATLGNAWWSNRTAGVFGGLLGALVGCLGTLLAWLSGQARARSFVLGALQAMVVLGAILGIGAAIALVMRQPYAVWFPLGLGALLLLGIMPSRLRECRKQYEEKELRRMASVDA